MPGLISTRNMRSTSSAEYRLPSSNHQVSSPSKELTTYRVITAGGTAGEEPRGARDAISRPTIFSSSPSRRSGRGGRLPEACECGPRGDPLWPAFDLHFRAIGREVFRTEHWTDGWLLTLGIARHYNRYQTLCSVLNKQSRMDELRRDSGTKATAPTRRRLARDRPRSGGQPVAVDRTDPGQCRPIHGDHRRHRRQHRSALDWQGFSLCIRRGSSLGRDPIP